MKARRLKMRAKIEIRHGIILLGIATLLSSCDTTKKEWELAKKANTVEAYQEFKRNNPNSEFDSQADRQIESIEWRNAEQEGSIEEYEKFLTNHPHGMLSYIAISKLASKKIDKAMAECKALYEDEKNSRLRKMIQRESGDKIQYWETTKTVTLSPVGGGIYEPVKEELAIDPWGNPYVDGISSKKIYVLSNGPDGKRGTSDDVTYPPQK
jgi:hypothetical protein